MKLHKNQKKYFIKKKSKKTKIYVILILLLIFITLVVKYIDNKIIPIVITKIDIITKNKINEIINLSIIETVKELNVTSENFYTKTSNYDGKIQSFSVNTILVNTFCSIVSSKISRQIDYIKSQKVDFPIGYLLNINFVSNIGPQFNITILPMGEASVDFESKFDSVGINQTNLQIWLNVSSKVKVVIPMLHQKNESDTIVTRKLSLVNTVISGDVPSTMFDENYLKSR